jgi:peroxiredoxin
MAALLSCALLPACTRDHVDTAPTAAAAPPASAIASETAVTLGAEIGKPAPDFSLEDVEGHPVHLADKRGSLVVLEWFNPLCPFVNKAHTKGSLKDTAARRSATGVVWLAVDSSAPGKQGYEPEAIRAAAARFGLSHPILRDPTGSVGRSSERRTHRTCS